jgi:hypothetical protein
MQAGKRFEQVGLPSAKAISLPFDPSEAKRFEGLPYLFDVRVFYICGPVGVRRFKRVDASQF